MSDLQGIVTFTGVDQVVSAHFVFTPGIFPAVATLDVVPQAGQFYSQGVLGFDFGTTSIRFPDCKVQRVTFHQSERGLIARLRILDRRWRWRFGKISGAYNLRRDDNSLVPSTQRTAQQLAQLCLDALGESGVDLSSLSSQLQPTVEWDYDNPAEALSRIITLCGSRVALGLNNQLTISKLGSGPALLLDETTMRYMLAGVDPLAPGRLSVASGRLRIQADFPLQAVGLDVDGETRPIDQLSYRPIGGWGTVDLEHFQSINDLRARELAKASVFRWYRIAVPFELPMQGAINDLSLILPIEDEQVETTITANGTARNRKAVVFGVWCDYASQAANRSDQLAPLPPFSSAGDPRSIVTTGFTIDRQRAIVCFERPVIRYTEGPSPAPALLVLRTATGVRNPATLAWQRLERTRTLASNDGTIEYLDRSDLIPTLIAQYDSYTYALTGATGNFDAINAEADRTLDAASSRYLTRQPQQVVYAGLIPFEPDGAIDAVIWRVGPQGAITEVFRQYGRHFRHGHRSEWSSGWERRETRFDTQRAGRGWKHQTVAY